MRRAALLALPLTAALALTLTGCAGGDKEDVEPTAGQTLAITPPSGTPGQEEGDGQGQNEDGDALGEGALAGEEPFYPTQEDLDAEAAEVDMHDTEDTYMGDVADLPDEATLAAGCEVAAGFVTAWFTLDTVANPSAMQVPDRTRPYTTPELQDRIYDSAYYIQDSIGWRTDVAEGRRDYPQERGCYFDLNQAFTKDSFGVVVVVGVYEGDEPIPSNLAKAPDQYWQVGLVKEGESWKVASTPLVSVD